MSAIYSRGVARIRHATTREIFEIPAEDLDWAEFASDERQMGPEIGYSAAVEHPALGLLTWELWEYPIGAENMKETDVNGHELLENISFGLQHLPDDNEPEAELPSLAIRLGALSGQLDALEEALARLRNATPMLGHNQPPPEFRMGLADTEIAEAQDSVVAIRAELAKRDALDRADPAVVQGAASRFARLAEKVRGWLTWAAAKAGAGIVTGIGAGLGKEIWEDRVELLEMLTNVAATLTVWAHHLGHLF
ncbi:MAG TPA: hypothetical protein VJM34_03495 [Novosphingobium sp.]|nr:hypothetical protein [Novosphingobium sp.]